MDKKVNITTKAYQWFPWMGETQDVTVGRRIGLKESFEDVYYCRNSWGHSRILPGSWVVDHPQLGLMCMDPEIFDVLANLAAVASLEPQRGGDDV